MRWFNNCTLLAVLVVLSSAQDNDQRPKRDLSLIKDLLLGKFFGVTEDPAPVLVRDNARIFKIQGTKGLLVKAVPKIVVKVESTDIDEDETAILQANPSIALISTYLGTKTLNETLTSLTNIKKLLQSGLLHTQEDIDKVVPPSIFYSSKIYDGAIEHPSSLYVTSTHCCKSNESLKQKPTEDVSAFTANERNIVVAESAVPVPVSPYIVSQSEIPVHSDVHIVHSPVIYDVPVEINPYTSLNIAPITVPIDSVYSYIQNDDDTLKRYETGPVVVQRTKNPHVLPAFIVNRIENAAAQAHKVNLSGSTLTKNFYSTYSSGYPLVTQHQDYIYEQPKEEAVMGNNKAHIVPSEYSYTTVHKNGASTTYTDLGEVKHSLSTNTYEHSIDRLKPHNNVLVIQNVDRAHPLPDFMTKRIENIAASTWEKSLSKSVHSPHAIQKAKDIHTLYDPHREQVKITVGTHAPVYGGYSYTTMYKDSNVNTHSNAETAKESTKFYIDENNNVKSDRDHNIEVTLVKRPTPLPTFMTNRFENALVTATKVKIPPQEINQQAVYVTPIPILPSKFEGVLISDSHIPKSPELPNDLSQYSYTTIHKDGTRTIFSDNGLNKAAYDNNKLRAQDNSNVLVTAKASNIPAIRLVQETNLNENLYHQSYLPIPTTVTITPKPVEKNNEGHRQVLLPKPIVSRYTYKQINNNMPDKFTIVRVGENPKFYGNDIHDIPSETIVDVTPYPVHSIQSTVSTPTDYVYIPPIISTREPVSETSVQDVSKHDNADTITSRQKVVTITKHKDDVPSAEPIVTSSDNSLNANPIVVRDEPTYSHIQDTKDESLVKPVHDNKNTLHRGDIPEPVF